MNWQKCAFVEALLPLASMGLGEYAGAQHAMESYPRKHVPAVLAGGAVGGGLGALLLGKPIAKGLGRAVRSAQRIGLKPEAAEILADDVMPFLSHGIIAPTAGLAAGIPLAAQAADMIAPETTVEKIRGWLGG